MTPSSFVYVAISFSSSWVNALVYGHIKCRSADETRMKCSAEFLETEWNRYYSLLTWVFFFFSIFYFQVTQTFDCCYILCKLLMTFWNRGGREWGRKKKDLLEHCRRAQKPTTRNVTCSSTFFVSIANMRTFLSFVRINTNVWISEKLTQLTCNPTGIFFLPTVTFFPHFTTNLIFFKR
jgi:hypothetical protein